MKPLLIILDDWEGRIQASACWNKVKELVEIKFLKEPIDSANDAQIEQVQFLMALRERTILPQQVFRRMPRLKLVLETGGDASHTDTPAARKQNIVIALGRRV